jgi:hypothetical protein
MLLEISYPEPTFEMPNPTDPEEMIENPQWEDWYIDSIAQEDALLTEKLVTCAHDKWNVLVCKYTRRIVEVRKVVM